MNRKATRSTPSGTKPRQCVNGCRAPVQAPSKVLCKPCFEALGVKFALIAESFLGDRK